VVQDKGARSIKTALSWSFFQNVASKALSLVVKLYLARLVLPDAFGLIGMAIVFISFMNIMAEMGMAAALIQRKEKDLKPSHWNTAFTLSLLVATVGWLLCVLLSSTIASFYNEELLRLLLPALGFSLIIDSLAVTQTARLKKDMRFKEMGLVTTVAVLVSSAVAMVMAYQGMGVWALVVKSLLSSGMRCVLLWCVSPWKPALSLQKSAFLDLFSFSGYVALERVLFFLTNNLDFLLIGKLLGSSVLGAYTLAFTLTDVIRQQIMNTFNNVLFPVYAKHRDDPARMRNYYLKVVRVSTLLVTPVMLLFALNAGPLIREGFGTHWQTAIDPLRILAVSAIIHSIGGTSATLIRGAGHARLVLCINLGITVLVTLPAIVIGCLGWGFIGAAWAIVTRRVIERVVFHVFVRRLFAIQLRDVLQAIRPGFVVAAFMCATHALLQGELESNPFLLVIRLLLEVLACGLAAFVFLPSAAWPGRSAMASR